MIIHEGTPNVYATGNVCNRGSRYCYSGCAKPQRNCIMLVKLVEGRRLDQMHEDPPNFYIHWSPELDRMYEKVLEETEAEMEAPVERDIARRSPNGEVPPDWVLEYMDNEGLLDEVEG